MNSTQQSSIICRSKNQVQTFVEAIEKTYLLDRSLSGDRREVPRMNVTMPVKIIPLDDDFQESNHQHNAISRDISSNGLGVVATNPIRPGCVLLVLEPCSGEAFNVIAKVMFCNEVGYYYAAGFEFICE